jgi:hypothetical protein
MKDDLMTLLAKNNPNMSKKELKKVEYEFLYLVNNLTYLKDEEEQADFYDDFLFSARNYPNLSLVKRFFHVYGMHLAQKRDLKLSEDNIDYEKYMNMLDQLYKEADYFNSSYKFKTILLRLFPEHTKELEDKSNIMALKLGMDERFFLDNVNSIITNCEKFCINSNIDLSDTFRNNLSFFDSFDSDFVGSRRFEATEKLNYVYQMVVNNYYNDLRSKGFIGEYDNSIEEFDKIHSFMASAADIIRTLPDDIAVSYTVTQLYAIQRSNDLIYHIPTSRRYEEDMNISYDALIIKHPELDTTYSDLEYQMVVDSIAVQIDSINHEEYDKKSKTKALLN